MAAFQQGLQNELPRLAAKPKPTAIREAAVVVRRNAALFGIVGAASVGLAIAFLVLASGCVTSGKYKDLESEHELAGHDAVLLSNGPGDPEPLVEEVAVVRELLGRVPVLGICLGHQLLGLAAGHGTYKLPFGHRGANHPVLERRTGRVLVTSQNHGFAVRGEGQAVTHVSLYDGTVEGLALPDERASSVQFHPEAGPGPHDAWPLIESWVEEVRLAAA